jgi:hypothetical protein
MLEIKTVTNGSEGVVLLDVQRSLCAEESCHLRSPEPWLSSCLVRCIARLFRRESRAVIYDTNKGSYYVL